MMILYLWLEKESAFLVEKQGFFWLSFFVVVYMEHVLLYLLFFFTTPPLVPNLFTFYKIGKCQAES